MSSSGDASMPSLCNICVFCSMVSAVDRTVVMAFTLIEPEASTGTSLIKTRSESSLPVAVSTPPVDFTCRLWVSISSGINQNPSSSVSTASATEPDSPVTTTPAPDTGPSTTRPSKASWIVIDRASSSDAFPSETAISIS